MSKLDYTDAWFASEVTRDVMRDRYHWTAGLGWLRWTGQLWAEVDDVTVRESIRQYAIKRYADAAASGDDNARDGWHKMLTAAKLRNAVDMARGTVIGDDGDGIGYSVQRDAGKDFDTDPWILNTPMGTVHLGTGDASRPDSSVLVTKIAGGSYRPGFKHEDWEAVLAAIRPDAREYLQIRCGQAATGFIPPDDILLFLYGGGENGKTTFLVGLQKALGTYALPASPKLLEANSASTEFAALKGVRCLIAEELQHDHMLDMSTIKRLVGSPTMTARRVYRDNMTWDATHALFTSGNFLPLVKETDHGSWRRLQCVTFPYTFRPADEVTEGGMDRAGDPGLRERIARGADHVWDAIVTWVVEGAMKWKSQGAESLEPPTSVIDDTESWRALSDKIMMFWRDYLVPDPEWCIAKTDMWHAFNRVLSNMGHSTWSETRFHPEFKSHVRSVGLSDQKKPARVPRSLPHPELSAYPMEEVDVNARVRVYTGVRFRTEQDEMAENGRNSSAVQTVQT